MSQKEARQYLGVAKRHLERVRRAADEGDTEEFILRAFYAYEAAVTAGAKAAAIKFDEKNHKEKAKLGRKLHELKIVSQDIADELADLNTVRKNVEYDEPDPDYSDPKYDEYEDLHEKLSQVENYIEEVGHYVDSRQEKNAKNQKGGQANSGNARKNSGRGGSG